MTALALRENGRAVGRVRHVIVTASGKPPGPGIGWHTACGTFWADGERTGRHGYGWGFTVANYLPVCKRCEKAEARNA